MKSFDDWKIPLSGVFLAILMLVTAPGVAQFVPVGTPSGTANTSTTYPSPYGNFYWGSRQQFLYPATELAAAGLTAGPITAIQFDVLDIDAAQPHENYQISIKQTATASLTAWESGMTNVYGPVTQAPTVGLNTFTFSSPYVWDGTSNIVIEICHSNTSFTDNCHVEWTVPLGYNGSYTYRADGTFTTNGGCATTLNSCAVASVNCDRRPMTEFEGTLASCTPLSSVAESNVTATSADISFSNILGDVYIEYGPAGFTPGTDENAGGGTIAGPFTTSPQTISPLTGSTTYDVYVRQDCGSEWSANAFTSFTTVCTAYGTPYFESFESLPTTANADWPTASCIESSPTITTTAYRWNREDGQPTSGTTTGPNAPHDGGIYAYTESSQGTTGNIATLDLGPIDLSSLSDPVLSFFYHMHGAAMGTLNVYASTDGVVWDPLTSFTGAQQASNTAPWLEQIVSLSAYSGQTISVRFEGVRGTSFTSDMAIDAISVEEAPSCLTPTDLSVDGFTATSADVSWSCGGCTGDFYVEYGPPGFTPGTGATAGGGTVAGPIAGTSTTISPLTPNTDYDIYVRQDCGAIDGFSDNSISASVYTGACTDGGPTSTSDSNLELVFLDGIGATEINQAGCPGILGVVDYTAQSADVSEILSFDLQIDYGTCGGNFGGAGSVWVDWNNNLTFEPGELIGSDSFTPPFSNTYSFTVPGGTTLGPKTMRVIQQEGGALPIDPCATFTWGSVWDFTLNVVAPPACSQPVATFQILPDCGTSEFSIEVDVTDAGSSTGGVVDITNNGGQPALTGVAPGTYIVGPFTAGTDVNVTVVNLDDNICNLVSPAIGTDCVLCTSGGPTSTADSNIELVEIDGFAGSGFSHVGCPGVLGVEDLTTLSVDIPNGFTYDLTVDLGTCGGNFAGAGTVWIDWNGDLEFSAAEVVGTSTVNPSSNVFSVSPPPGTPLGAKIMRVMQQEGGSLPLDPCASFTWGSVMDFTVNVIADPGCLPPDADLTVDASSCSGASFEYFINVDILSVGDSPGGEVTISNSFNGNTIPNATVAGSPYVYGPFPSGTVLDVNLEHLGNALCTFSTGFTHDCPPLNDLCANAEVIPVNAEGACMGAATSASTNAASTDGPTATCLIGGLTDVWFEFTTGSSPYINWEITLGTMEAIGVEIWDDCPGVGSSVYCLADATSDPNTFVELEANSTYLFRVLTLPQFSGTFDICIETGPDSPSENCQPEYSSTTPTLDVLGPIPGGEIISDLDVVLNMSNPNVGNLLIELVSPCGTTITLQEEQCDGLANLDVQYNDGSADTFTEFCPLGIGEVQPEQALASYNNQPIVGTWTLNVTSGGIPQAINSWCLIPTLNDGCPPPQIVVTDFTDNSITVDSDPASCYSPLNYSTYDLTWTGGGSATGVTFPYEITGLSPGTFYVIDAIANCTVGGSSSPGGVSQTTLNCTPAELCTYELTLENTDGTGWDGAFATVDNGWTITDYFMDPDVSVQTWTILACPGNPITLSVSNGGNGALPNTKTISFVNSDNVEVYFEAGPPESTLYSQADGCPDCAAVTNIDFTRIAADLVEVTWTNIALPANVDDIDVIVGTEDLFGFTPIASVNVPAGSTSASVDLGSSFAFTDVTVQVITNCTNEGSGLSQAIVTLPACIADDQCEYLFNLTSTGDGWGPFSLDVLLDGTISYEVALATGSFGTQTIYACPSGTIDITAIGESVAYSGPPFCNQAQGGPGFPQLQACEDVVCADDAFCCDNTWDGLCAGSAEGFEECAPCLDDAPPGLVCSALTYEVVLNPSTDDVTLWPVSDFCDVADGETFFSEATCPTCFPASGVAVDDVNSTSVDVVWNSPNAAGTDVTVYVGLPGFDPLVDPVSSATTTTTATGAQGPLTVGGLTPNTNYQIIVIENCSGEPAPASPAVPFSTLIGNDTCADATPISLEAPADCPANAVSGTTAGGATNSAGSISCIPPIPDPFVDAWYTFNSGTGNPGVLLNVTLGSQTTIALEVYDACGGTVVFCTDGTAELPAEIPVDPNTDYYVRVLSLASTVGTHDICVSQIAGCTVAGSANYNDLAGVDDGSCILCPADADGTGPNGISIDMEDTFGDGWDGTVYNIYDNSVPGSPVLLFTGDLDNADVGDGTSFGTDYYCLEDGCYVFEVAGGSFPTEKVWSINNVDFGPISGTGLTTGVQFSINGGCIIDGCTSPTAINYDPAATNDDGSCIEPDCPDPSTQWIYCYDNNETSTFYIEPLNPGDNVNLVFLQGGFESSTFDELFIYDGDNAGAPLLFSNAGVGTINDLGGTVVTSTLGNGLFISIFQTDGSVSCASGSYDPIIADIFCGQINIEGCTDPAAPNYDPSANVDDGSCITCDAGETLVTLNMFDSFGDGWNGATYTITSYVDFFNPVVVATGDIDNADEGDGSSFGTDYLCLEDGCYEITVTGGGFPTEVDWNLEGVDGGTIFGNTPPETVQFTINSTCPIPGCTSPGAVNYDPFATLDDGSCVFPPSNDDCTNAQALTPVTYPATLNALGTLTGASTDGSSACVGTNGADVFYSFNVPLENHYWVNLNPFSGFAGVIEVLDACDGSVVACEFSGPTAPFCDQAQGSAGFSSDPACEAAVCAGDSFCCTNTWDGICAGAAAAEPACANCLSTAEAGSGPISVFIQNLPAGDYIVRIRDYFGGSYLTPAQFLVNVQMFPFAGVQDNPNNFLYACNQGGFQLEDFVGATPQSGQGALDYQWYIYEEGGTFSNEWQRGEPNYVSRCTWLGMDYGTTYNVYVRILLDVPNVGPVWGVYPYLNPGDPFAPGAAECTISTAANVTPTEIRPNYTPTNAQGNNYQLCDFVVAYNVSESEDFRWRFDGNNNFGDAEDIVYVRGSANPSVRLSWVNGLLPGATYQVGVEVQVDGNWSGYSTILPISLALPPNTVRLRDQFCPVTLPANSYVLSQSVCSADSYTFEFAPQGGGTTRTFTSGNYVCFFNNLSPALTPGVYDVRVKVTQNGISSDFGPICEVTISGPGAPGAGGIQAQRDLTVNTNVSLFPNPTSGEEVRLSLDGLNEGNHEVNIAVYDVYGKLISSDGFGHEGTELSRLIRFDENLAMGMYMVHIFVDGEQFAVERLVVK